MIVQRNEVLPDLSFTLFLVDCDEFIKKNYIYFNLKMYRKAEHTHI